MIGLEQICFTDWRYPWLAPPLMGQSQVPESWLPASQLGTPHSQSVRPWTVGHTHNTPRCEHTKLALQDFFQRVTPSSFSSESQTKAAGLGRSLRAMHKEPRGAMMNPYRACVFLHTVICVYHT